MIRFYSNNLKHLLLLTILLITFTSKSFAKCYSVGDASGRVYTSEIIKKTPVFIKGQIEDYQDNGTLITFKINVIGVLKGKKVPDKLSVSLRSQKGVVQKPPEKEFKDGQIYIFGVRRVDKLAADIITTSCFPNLTEKEFVELTKYDQQDLTRSEANCSTKETIQFASI